MGEGRVMLHCIKIPCPCFAGRATLQSVFYEPLPHLGLQSDKQGFGRLSGR